MPQIDLITYSSSVLFVYIGFWIYFVACVVSATVAFQRVVINIFYGYTFLLPTYVRFVGSFINK